MDFVEWQKAVEELIPGFMIYTVDLRRMFKRGLLPGAAIQEARAARLIHARGSSSAPSPVKYRGKVPQALAVLGKRRKPLWTRALVEARIKAAIYAVIVEAETHRLEPDGVEYVHEMKAKLLG